MSRFGFLRKSGRLDDPIPATALVVRGDPGYSATTWWTAALRLRIAAPGHAPVVIEHESRAVREKTPFTGLTLPVVVERHDPTQVRILWDDVPTLERRIAERYPPLLAPRSAWRDVIDADPSQADQKPDWGDGQVAGWPFGAALRRGRRAGTAIVIGHSWDPEPYRSGDDFVPPRPAPYSYGGKVRIAGQQYLGWLLLCVIPPEGDRYAVHLRTMIRRDRLAPVLPVALRRSKPMDVEIAWDDAPEVRALEVRPEEVQAPEAEVAEVKVAEVEVAEVEAPEVKAPIAAAVRPPAAPSEQAERPPDQPAKPRPRRAARKSAASRNGTEPRARKPAAPRSRKPAGSQNGKPADSPNGKPAAGKAKPRASAPVDR